MTDQLTHALRSDARDNRELILDAARALFAADGLNVPMGEIARRSGVGPATLYRRFPTKEALIVAVLVDRIHHSIERAQARLQDENATQAVFDLIDDTLERQAEDRTLFEGLAGPWMTHPEILSTHHAMLDVLGELLRRAQDEGGVRPDIGGVDMLLMVKGVCEVQRTFPNAPREIGRRQLDLVKAAIRQRPGLVPLRGRPPSAEDLESALAACVASPETVEAVREAHIAESG